MLLSARLSEAEAYERPWRECLHRYASVKYPLQLAGAHVAGVGVGSPEARGLCRVPPKGRIIYIIRLQLRCFGPGVETCYGRCDGVPWKREL